MQPPKSEPNEIVRGLRNLVLIVGGVFALALIANYFATLPPSSGETFLHPRPMKK